MEKSDRHRDNDSHCNSSYVDDYLLYGLLALASLVGLSGF